MDTSKSDFVWSVYSIGDLGSLISDVAIISDTCIIAVGEIYVGDSLYNAVRWNGNSWDYLKIPTRVFGGNIRFTQLRAIEAFSENEWWTFSSAGSYSHWDGSQWKTEYLIEQSGGGRKLWGTSSSNLYLGGTNGSLSYFNGSFWQKMETCTTLDINDIYGTKNEKTGEYEILAVASSPMTSYERIILQISGASATTKADSGISTSLTGIWFVPNVRYYTVGGGIFYKRNLTNGTHWGKNPGDRYSLYYKYAIRGNGLNDVFVACGGGDILHFNGDSWKNFRDQMPPFSGFYSNLAIRKNTLVAVGYKDGAGVIAVGKR
jgi:hypothetical protein